VVRDEFAGCGAACQEALGVQGQVARWEADQCDQAAE